MIRSGLDDHAFASGPVFARPANFVAALARTRSPWGGARLRAVWRQFEAGAHVAPGVRLALSARLINRHGRDHATIGPDCVIRGIIRIEPQGQLRLSELVYIGDDVILSAMSAISIGRGTLIAHGVQIFDNDTHPIDPEERVNDFRKKLGHPLPRPITIGAAPVTIGARCWIGMNSIVMKGVEIGEDAIVASGSVVTRDVPARVVVAGNPARVVRELGSPA
jgi:acetyltransferase-like isoleucine patch superfamily enzyme